MSFFMSVATSVSWTRLDFSHSHIVSSFLRAETVVSAKMPDQAGGHECLHDFHGGIAGDFEFPGFGACCAECLFLMRGKVGVR